MKKKLGKARLKLRQKAKCLRRRASLWPCALCVCACQDASKARGRRGGACARCRVKASVSMAGRGVCRPSLLPFSPVQRDGALLPSPRGGRGAYVALACGSPPRLEDATRHPRLGCLPAETTARLVHVLCGPDQTHQPGHGTYEGKKEASTHSTTRHHAHSSLWSVGRAQGGR